jgi:hypothetical protein
MEENEQKKNRMMSQDKFTPDRWEFWRDIPDPDDSLHDEEFEEQALYEDYREELYRDRRRRLGWEDEDENFDGLDDFDRMQSSSN